MKKKNFLFISCLLGIFAFSSCQKNLYDESKQPEKETKMVDLVVPDNFDWSGSQEVKAQITPTKTETKVSVYLDKDCNEESLFIQMDMNIETADNQAAELPIEIPSYVENVYVKYEGINEVFTLPVQDGKITIKAPENKSIKSSRAAVRANENTDYTNILSYNGTIMFEDMYPTLGDYDFNDFVAWYNLRTFYKYSTKDKGYYASKMCISIQVRAVGGIYDYEPYIRMTKVKFKDLTIETTEADIELIEGPEGEAIISYKKPTSPNGYKYYNAEKDEMVTPGKFKDIWLVFKTPINTVNLLDSTIDMYLAKKNKGQEIHLKGYEPVYGQHQDYVDKNNFVWGIKVWASIYHAAEGQDFLKAYPTFKQWVTSGGTEKKNWWSSEFNMPDYRYVIQN